MQLTLVTMITLVVAGMVYAGASRMRTILGKEKTEAEVNATGLHTEFLLWELTGSTILNAKMPN
jgi:hypothetical protein